MLVTLKTVIKQALTLLIGLQFIAGCDLSYESDMNLKKRLVIVLLDETISFKLDKNNKMSQSFWPVAIEGSKKIVKNLRKGDSFVMLGIGDWGYHDKAVLINYTTIDSVNDIFVRRHKRRLLAKLDSLKSRKVETHTNILGTLKYAADIMAEHRQLVPSMVIFSDMKQTPRYPTLQEAKNFNLPDSGKIFCFYASAEGEKEFHEKEQLWKDIFNQAHAEEIIFSKSVNSDEYIAKYFSTISVAH